MENRYLKTNFHQKTQNYHRKQEPNHQFFSERITKHNVGYSYEVGQTPAGD
ncbi:hypothetical protein H6G97_22290 [Nostoc flagelliforme FACHB-838]|uniref:Uncharacterized protein n=1 Tax=Nostoc flagelliforme FACHB-838 TaxID=2692904 RepID=A0ABR8DRT1_9NOSO|nr:hypothetical protein [Nostoc flagelliforme]MBD2532162.1 hypothetical protein [Nostoc flagelliforme FACHB-838]